MASILVVDDDPDICDLLALRLELVGHDVVVRHDGVEAMEVLADGGVDLVLLDWMMPRLDGLEVCRTVRSDPGYHRMAVLMLTAKAQQQDIQQVLAAGADDYIVKPFSPTDLVTRVDDALRRLAR